MNEIASYSPKLASRPQIVAVSKIDTLPEPPNVDELARAIGLPVLAISSHSGHSVKELIGRIVRHLRGDEEEL